MGALMVLSGALMVLSGVYNKQHPNITYYNIVYADDGCAGSINTLLGPLGRVQPKYTARLLQWSVVALPSSDVALTSDGPDHIHACTAAVASFGSCRSLRGRQSISRLPYIEG